MTMLLALIPRTAVPLVRRLTRTQNATWPRGRLYVPAALALVALWAGVTVAVSVSHPDDPLVISFTRPAIALLLVIVAGVATITMEGSRDRSGATERALECLPLSRRSAAFLVRLPSLALAALVVLLPIGPGIAALIGTGTPPGQAIGVVVAALCSGLCTVAVPYLVVSSMMRNARWDAVRFPTTVLLWAMAVGGQTVIALRDLADPKTAPPLWMPVAHVLHAVAKGSLDVAAIATFGVLGMVAALTMGLTFALSLRMARAPMIRREWSGRGAVRRTVGELRYALRDPAIRANGGLSLLLSALVVTGTLLLPDGLRPHVESVALLALGILASASARAIRGIYPLKLPPQRLLGLSATSWALSTSVVVIALTGLLLVPGIVLVSSAVSPAESVLALLSTFLLSAAAAVTIGSVLPMAPQNVLGQGLASSLTLGLFLTLQQSLGPVFAPRAGLLTVVSAMILSIAVAIAVAAETLRWLPPSLPRHKEHHP